MTLSSLEAAKSWVPCGSHPVRETADCTYCAIDCLADAVSDLQAENERLKAELLESKGKSEEFRKLGLEDNYAAEDATLKALALLDRAEKAEAALEAVRKELAQAKADEESRQSNCDAFTAQHYELADRYIALEAKLAKAWEVCDAAVIWKNGNVAHVDQLSKAVAAWQKFAALSPDTQDAKEKK